MGDIYSINNWVSSTKYNLNDIIQNNNLYYYATNTHLSSSSFNNDLNAGLWNGQLNFNGESKPYFFWKTSYEYNLDIKPAVKKIQFGDGYTVDQSDGINNILLPFNLVFEDRDLQEYTAILHFLHTQNGVTRFFYIPPAPFNVVKKFICQNWTAKQSFYDKYTITCILEERVN